MKQNELILKGRISGDEWMIQVEGICKSFGKIFAIRDIELNVKRGDFLTIVGPNGAGKTTLLKILSTLMKPTRGEGKIAGFDLRKEKEELRKRIGMASHRSFLYDNLTAYENLKFYGKLYEVKNLGERIKELIDEVGLGSRLYDAVGTLSRGMKQRLSIARSIIHNPVVLLLDEPFTGLDQWSAQRLEEILNKLRREEKTIIMTTHNLSRCLGLSDMVAIQNWGKIQYQQGMQEIELRDLEDLYSQYTEKTNL
jgi:heme ABC exporter ATP-binding subunit CcmA